MIMYRKKNGNKKMRNSELTKLIPTIDDPIYHYDP